MSNRDSGSLGFGESLDVKEIYKNKSNDFLGFHGHAVIEALHRPAFERGVREVIWRDEGPNKIMEEGRNLVLNVMFRNTASGLAAPGNWYIGLYTNAFDDSALAGTETYSSIGATNEFDSYNEASRPNWSPAAPANGAFASVTAATFTCSAGATLGGIFIISTATKDTTGTLWSIKPFTTGDRVVDSSTILQVSYLVDTDGSD